MEINIQEFLEGLPHLYSNSDYWLFRANGGEYYTDFNLNNYIGIGWNDITLNDIEKSKNSIDSMKKIVKAKLFSDSNSSNLNESTANDSNVDDLDVDDLDTENLIKLLENTELNPNETNSINNPSRKISAIAGQLLKFYYDLKINDLVLVPSEGSEMFLVGKITSAPEQVNIPDEYENKNYAHSNFSKIRHVKWLGKFNRSDADAKLYKIIYSQHTINDANPYKPFINRALFDAYIMDDSEIHITYHVTQAANITAKSLGAFIYEYSQLFENFIENPSDLQVKVNVQSPGPVESTTKKIGAAAITFMILSLVTGGYLVDGDKIKCNISKGTFEINQTSLQEQNRKNKLNNVEVDKQKGLASNEVKHDKEVKNIDISKKKDDAMLHQEEMAYKTAKELQVPISSLGINLPKKAEEQLQIQLDKNPEYKKAIAQKNSTNSSENEDNNSLKDKQNADGNSTN